MTTSSALRDVFICHASEDKKEVVEPLVSALEKAGISVWFDKAQIKWGDSLTEKINEGLATSRYVLVVVSSAFLDKRWPRKELHAALNREITSGKTSVLPLMTGSDEEIAAFHADYPLHADKLHLRWTAAARASVIVDELRSLLA